MTSKCFFFVIFSVLSVASNASADCVSLQYIKQNESDPRIGRKSAMENTKARYIFEGFLHRDEQRQVTEDSQGNLLVPCPAFSSQASDALRVAQRSGEVISYDELETAWANFVTKGFSALNYEQQLPSSLDEFLRVSNYRNWPREIIKESLVKQKTRIIYRSPQGYIPSMRVADTHDDRKGDPSTSVRETEVALERPDGNWDFFVYDSSGQPSQYSEFPSGNKPVPTFCMGCHYNFNQRKMNRLLQR